ncbi:MAG: SatD family protein [Candidatus Latescibacteria bacterium]|nr:SatD family protein [Candidatus Latescibacterota bacterium]
MNNLVKISQPTGLVLLADVRGSRERGNPVAGLDELRNRAESANQRFAADLLVPFSISGGDEIQALLTSPAALWEIVEHLDLVTGEPIFRFGCGVGALQTAIAARSWEMDGACFHLAREAIERGKLEQRWAAFAGFGAPFDGTLDALARSLQVIREDWTERQREALVARKNHESQKETAEAMGIDPTTLSKMLNAAHAKEYREIQHATAQLLTGWWEEGHGGLRD